MTRLASDIRPTVCVILARGGSKGIPQKNLRRVGGVSLVARSIRAGRAAPSLAAIYVSTDDDDIAAEARMHGARVIQRPADLSGDTASSEEGWLHALEAVRAEFPDVGRLVLLQCTSPFTTSSDIEACLREMEDKGTDCALSVVSDHSFLWGLDDAGLGHGINHDETSQRQRRQDLSPTFRESGAIYCVAVEAFERTGRRFCGSVALCPVDHPPLEIDSVQDLTICTQIAQVGTRSDIDEARLKKVRAIVMDFDGVHTDNSVWTDQEGRESVRTSRGDGMGLEMLRHAHRWELLILSKERNPVVLKRAAKLQIDVHHAIEDKVSALEAWLAERNLGWDNLLYVGNDVNDRAAMERAGLSACPSDAHPEILGLADWILPLPGGGGALRSMSDTLLSGS